MVNFIFKVENRWKMRNVLETLFDYYLTRSVFDHVVELSKRLDPSVKDSFRKFESL